jgi:energy-converting hydrogenase Eha subunit H
MKIKAKRFADTVVIGLTIFQWLIFLPSTTHAGIGKNVPSFNDQYLLSFSADVFKILSVLEKKMEDQQSLEKTRDKLFTLNHEQIRLMASLSDRVAKGGNTTGSEVAFLLMTALITLF